MKKNGISLVVLIITIVVVIILAGVIILNLVQTKTIETSKEGVLKQDIKTLQEELDMYASEEYVKSQGEFDITELDANTKEEVEKYIPSIKGTKYEEYVRIEDGKIVIIDTMPEQEKNWAKEITGDKTPVIEIGDVAEENSTVTGRKFSYKNPVIPTGFKPVNTDDASWSNENGTVSDWNNGLVIVDEDENEFVWVPCTIDGSNGTIKYSKNLDYKSYYDASKKNTFDDEEALPMKSNNTRIIESEQISKYGGFYIGRYEAGVPKNQNTIDGNSEETSNVYGTPVVKRGAITWTWIAYEKAMQNAKKLYESSTNVKSGLVTGTQWDTVMKWLETEGIDVNSPSECKTWGNYRETTGAAQFDVDGVTKISGIKQTAGYSELWKAKNIYDLAGSTWEWTGEIYENRKRICRSGDYGGWPYPAAYRMNNNPADGKYNRAFRIVLYVM